MISAAIQQKRMKAVVEVLDFMRKRGLTHNDLIQISGEDFRSASPTRKEKARRVEKCWSLMARLSVCFTDLVRPRRSKPCFSVVASNSVARQ